MTLFNRGILPYLAVFLVVLACAAPIAAAAGEPLKVAAVSASTDDGNLPANANDGDLDTRWSASGDGNWILFDLGERQTIGYIGIAFHKGNERISKFELEVSDDAVQWTRVYAGAGSGRTVDLEAFDFPDVSARYVRYIGHGNSSNAWNSLLEVQIYPPNPAGLILRRPETARPKETPVPVIYVKPGLVNPDGTDHAIPAPHRATGKTLNVLDFGADPKDSAADDAPAIQKAIDVAASGDEVYLPDGVYNLNSGAAVDRYANLILKDGVNLRGQSEAGVLLLSSFNAEDGKKGTTKVLKIQAAHDILVSHLTVTSTFAGKYSTDTGNNNPEAGGPLYGVMIEEASGVPCYNITLDGVTVEKFQRMGIRISKSHDVVVRNATFRNATDLGGGGAGYGVSIQGEGNGKDRLGYANDCRYNVVEDCRFVGPYLRHAVLLQYFAHNNLVRNNVITRTGLDAIDLHGEDEYLNEVRGNRISDVVSGAAVGLGNTGATHDASGPYNYIHDNTIVNCREGIKVSLASPDTLIENNTITGCTVRGGKGIYLLNAPRTMVAGNKILDNQAQDFWGILLAADPGAGGVGPGDPQDVQIAGNTLRGNANGLKIEAGKGIVVKDNTIEGNGVDYLNLSKNPLGAALVPFKINPIGPLARTASPYNAPSPVPAPIPSPAPAQATASGIMQILPTDDAFVEHGKPDMNFGMSSINRVKSTEDGTIIRIAYLKFQVEHAASVKEAVFQFTGRITESNPIGATYEFAVFGLTNDDWQESAITWLNSPNHAPGAPEVTGLGESAFLLGTVTMTERTVKPYRLDVTKFVQSQTDGYVTLMMVDLKKQGGNTDPYAKDRSDGAQKPYLFVTY